MTNCFPKNRTYGITQNPDTKNYIVVFQYEKCERCDKQYEQHTSRDHFGQSDAEYEWCKPCQINNLEENFVNWTSESEEIDEYIRNMQLNINNHNDIILEWIPYNQFYNIKEIKKDEFTPVYSAMWKEGPLIKYDFFKERWIRESGKEVALKCAQNKTELLNKVLFFINLFFSYL
jgi:hypothetical protein